MGVAPEAIRGGGVLATSYRLKYLLDTTFLFFLKTE
jgi:hypothetical protein